ncbi:putative NRPS-like protein biosynthetic cluster [Myotisia sp. PD_48]|nr:putative NRPS-like protein biosynthetic cluster [Myotisia sp. PD_48]
MEFDRNNFIPSHEGDNILPLSPFFSKLVRYAHRRPQRLAVRDLNLGVEKTYSQLLTDVIAVRKALRATLDTQVLKALAEGKQEVYIGLLAAGGYEYTVAFIAIIALGAAVVPMSVQIPVHEASYFVQKARCVAVITSEATKLLAQTLVEQINTTDKKNLPCFSVAPFFCSSPLPTEEIQLSSGHYLDDNAAAVVIFTSGTTGPPKGAVMRRGWLHDCAESVMDHYRFAEGDVFLHVMPVHHATGVGVNFVPCLVAGACLEFRSGSVDVAWLWERFRSGGLAIFSGVPTIYMRMMRYYENNIATLPEMERRQYINGARGIRVLMCGTSALPSPVEKFWIDILGGRRISIRYGATEIGAVFKAPLNDNSVPEGSVGPTFPGVIAKLSEGDEGEILIKSPHMFSKYLYDEEATAKAHDEEGFYKTGDIARREGKNHFIVGRANIDIIKSGGYKLSALDIEREILGLPYVGEVMVVGIADQEFGQRVGAVVSLREGQKSYNANTDRNSAEKGGLKSLTIDDLRKDLRSVLAGYKMPTLLRVIEGELPKGATGKVIKKVLGPKYFPANYEKDENVQVWVSSKSKL